MADKSQNLQKALEAFRKRQAEIATSSASAAQKVTFLISEAIILCKYSSSSRVEYAGPAFQPACDILCGVCSRRKLLQRGMASRKEAEEGAGARLNLEGTALSLERRLSEPVWRGALCLFPSRSR